MMLFMDNRMTKWIFENFQDQIEDLDCLIESLLQSSIKLCIPLLISGLRINFKVVQTLVTRYLPSQLTTLEELCKEGLLVQAQIPIVEGVEPPAIQHKPELISDEYPKYLVRMNIRNSAEEGAKHRFFTYSVWTEDKQFFWQAKGDNIVQSDRIVRLVKFDDSISALRLKLANHMKIIRCLSGSCYKELKDKLLLAK